MRQKFILLILLLIAMSSVCAQTGLQKSEQLFGSSQDDGIEFLHRIQSLNQQNLSSGDRTQFRKLDSLIVSDDAGSGMWLNDYRYQYFYDADGRIIELLTSRWDTISLSWEHTYNSKSEIFYNSQNLPDSTLSFRWDIANATWNKRSKKSYSFNGNGLLEIYEQATWDDMWGIYEWRPQEQLKYFYNSSENDTLIIESSFDLNTQNWWEVEREKREFDANNNLIIRHNSGAMVGNFDLLDSMLYDGNNDMLSMLTYKVNSPSDAQPAYKRVWTYIADNKFDTLIWSQWVDSIADWLPKQCVLNAYDVNIDIDTTNYQVWDYNLSAWQTSMLFSLEHDSIWPNNQLWLPNVGDHISYNIFDVDYHTSMITELKINLYEDGQLQVVEDWVYYYSDIALQEVPLLEASDIQIYPNPANNIISVVFESGTSSHNISNYQIFDTGGKQILSGALNNNGTINVAALPQGIYYIRMGSEHEYLTTIPLVIAK